MKSRLQYSLWSEVFHIFKAMLIFLRDISLTVSAVPTRRGGSKSPLRKDQNENESSESPIAANIQPRNPARVAHSKHTKALRSKRINSASRTEEIPEESKAGE